MAVWSTVNFQDSVTYNRLDAEFFQPEFLANDVLLKEQVSSSLGDLSKDMRYGLNVPPDYSKDGLPFVRAMNLKEGGIEGEILNIPFKPEEVGSVNLLSEGDVLIVRSGANVGDVGIITEDQKGWTFGSYVIRCRVRNVDPFFLCIFLLSLPGRLQTVRYRSGAAQPNISIPNLREITVPLVSEILQQQVRNIFKLSISARQKAKQSMAEAEAILTAALGLAKLDVSPRLSYEGMLSEVSDCGRLDAEFFQPKYEHLLQHMQKTGQAARLGDFLHEPAKRGLQPVYDEKGTVAVINSQHVGPHYIDLETNRKTSKTEAERNNRKSIVRKYDVLLNSTGYQTIGRAQALLEEIPAVVDSHVTILRPKSPLDPVFLGVFLNALPGFLQTERHWTGSSGQIELRLEPIEDYTVWLAPDDIQQKIRQQVENAHKARQESRRLLDEAKRTVEAAIQEGT